MEYPGFRSKTLDFLQSHEMEPLKCENVRLLSENAELVKMVGLMMENLQLRCTLRDHETNVRCISLPEKPCKDRSTNIECKKDDVEETPCHDANYIQHCQRLAGEIAFQLDRRILAYIFQGQCRLYGFRVSEIENKILQMTTCPVTKTANKKLRCELFERYVEIMCKLKKLHYNPELHPNLSEHLVNKFGLIKERPAPDSCEYMQYCDPKMLRKMICVAVTNDTPKDAHVLLSCLLYLAEEDGEPIFNW